VDRARRRQRPAAVRRPTRRPPTPTRGRPIRRRASMPPSATSWLDPRCPGPPRPSDHSARWPPDLRRGDHERPLLPRARRQHALNGTDGAAVPAGWNGNGYGAASCRLCATEQRTRPLRPVTGGVTGGRSDGLAETNNGTFAAGFTRIPETLRKHGQLRTAATDGRAGSTTAMSPALSRAAINGSSFRGTFMNPKDPRCDPAGDDPYTESLARSRTW
jgi:hypothetical protein